MKTIVFDFDGVIHTGYNGWKDGSIYGEIDTNIIDYIKILMKDYYVVISSNRPAKQIVEHMKKLDLGVEFEIFNKDLDKNMYWNKKGIVGILYIDDRSYRYSNLEELKMFIDNLGE